MPLSQSLCRRTLSSSCTIFHKGNIETPIVIEATLGDLVDDFCSLKKYGHQLRGWDNDKLEIVDEPDDHLESVLTIRFTVGKDLEPQSQLKLRSAGNVVASALALSTWWRMHSIKPVQ
jgi:hypothetical protein